MGRVMSQRRCTAGTGRRSPCRRIPPRRALADDDKRNATALNQCVGANDRSASPTQATETALTWEMDPQEACYWRASTAGPLLNYDPIAATQEIGTSQDFHDGNGTLLPLRQDF